MPITVDLAAHYRRDDTHENKRAKFYAQMHMVHGLSGWRAPVAVKVGPKVAPGRDGAQLEMRFRDRTSTLDVNINSGPFEWLRETKRLTTREDKAGAEMARVVAGEKFRSAVQGAHTSPMKSVDLESASSGGFGPRNVADHKFDCMKRIQTWRGQMAGTRLYTLLETVIVLEDFSAIMNGDRTLKPNAIEGIRVGLDIIALDMSMITARSFRARWSFLPSVSHSPKARRFS